MNNRERTFLLTIFCLITTLITADLITDFSEGVPFWHILIEGSAGVMAVIGILLVLKNMLYLKASLSKEKRDSAAFRREAEQWRTQAKEYICGLSQMIEKQLSEWDLTPAEKDVSFFLLKGFSLNEIAEFRCTSEKTVRAQLTSIYAKTGLKNRAEFAAYFLEDLLPASSVNVKKG